MHQRNLFFLASLALTFLATTLQGKGDRPNILFCIGDDISYPHMGAYGCGWVKTPAFDRVAREGILFTRAYTPNAKCAPSRSCLLTGRNSWQLEEAANHFPVFPPKFKTYVEALAGHGYTVGYTGKGWAPGSALTEDGKKRQLCGPVYRDKKLKPPTKKISATDYAANFEDFLKKAEEGEPWCFWYGALEPHRAYEFGTGVNVGGKTLNEIDKVPAFWPDNEAVRNDMLDYAFEIEHFDQHLGRMLDTLEANGQLANTLVIVTADNGMPFPRVKGQEYEMSNHLPFAAMWPDGITSPGRTVDDYISFIDVAPTFLEVAGLPWDSSGMQPSPGRSLTDIFRSEKSGSVIPDRDYVLIGKERHDIGRPDDQGYPIRGIVRDNMLYLRNFAADRWPSGNPETGYLNCDGGATKTAILQGRKDPKGKKFWEMNFGKRPEEELYDLSKDPDCVNNLAGDPSMGERKSVLANEMVQRLEGQKDPRIAGNGGVFENYQYSDPKTRDFYNRYLSGEKIKAGWVNESDFETEPVE